MPKVSPPVGTVRQSTGSVLDKIQAELAETKKREDELRKTRRDMFRYLDKHNKPNMSTNVYLFKIPARFIQNIGKGEEQRER